jgi:hypothetical protein
MVILCIYLTCWHMKLTFYESEQYHLCVRKGEKSLIPDVKGLGVWRLGTFWWKDTRLTIVPSQTGPA